MTCLLEYQASVSNAPLASDGRCQKETCCILLQAVHAVDLVVLLCSLWSLEFVLRPTVSRPVRLGIGLPFGAHDQILLFFYFCLTIILLLFLGCPLWQEDGSVTYSAIADWSGNWGPITTLYRLIWDCVPFLSPLTTRRATVEVF
jgi:hypothetical protein